MAAHPKGELTKGRSTTLLYDRGDPSKKIRVRQGDPAQRETHTLLKLPALLEKLLPLWPWRGYGDGTSLFVPVRTADFCTLSSRLNSPMMGTPILEIGRGLSSMLPSALSEDGCG